MSQSEFNINDIKEEDRGKLYELSHTFVIHEAQAIWNTSQLFLVANTFLAAIIGTNFTSNNEVRFYLSLLGMAISLLWLASCIRTTKYYRFRIAQARQREPKGWMLLDGDAKNLADGDTIEIGCKKYSLRLPILGTNLSNLYIVVLLIISFLVFYSVITYMSVSLIKHSQTSSPVQKLEDYENQIDHLEQNHELPHS